MHNWGSRTNGPQGIWGNRGYGSQHVLIPGIAEGDRGAYHSILCHTIPYHAILFHIMPYYSILCHTRVGTTRVIDSTRVAFFSDSDSTRVTFIFFGNDSTRVTFLKMTRLDSNFVLTTRVTFSLFSIKKPANLLTVCRIFACMQLS